MTLSAQEIQKQIEEIREINKMHAKAKERVSELNQYCLGVIKSRLPKFRTVYDFMAGSAGPSWQPSFKVVVWNGDNCIQSGAYFHYVGGEEFAWFKDCSHRVYEHQRVEGKSDPFDTNELLRVCEELTEELGVEVRLSRTEVVRSISSSYPQNNDEVRVMYPGCEITLSGEIEYGGWDCKDRYCVFIYEGKKHLLYGTGGHGGGMNKHVVEGESLEEFYKVVGGPVGWLW